MIQIRTQSVFQQKKDLRALFRQTKDPKAGQPR